MSTQQRTIPGYSLIHSVLLFQQVHSDRKSGRGRGRSKGRSESIGHIGDEFERQFTRANAVNDRQNNEPMNEKTQNYGHEIIAQLSGDHAEIFHFQDLPPDEEKDAHRCHVDDPGGDGHHGLGQADEKVHKGFTLFPHDGQGHAKEH